MNPIKIVINNLNDYTKLSFKTFKIAINDFPTILGLRFRTTVYSVQNALITIDYKIRTLLSKWYAVIETNFKSQSRIVSTINSVFFIAKQLAKSKLRLLLNTVVYPVSQSIIKLSYKITRKTIRVYFTSTLKKFRLIIPYKIFERRDMTLQDCNNMSIKEFIIKQEIV